jgi:predicted Zn-dependent protease
VQTGFDETPGYAVKRFRAEIDKDGGLGIGNRYGLVLALTRSSEFEAARAELAPLLKQKPGSIPIALAAADVDLQSGHLADAEARLREQLALNPGNHPVTMALSDTLLRAGKAAEAEKLLTEHVRVYPNDPQVWYMLAEVHGLAGHVLDVHRARAEYFILNGALDQAERQLGYALNLTEGSYTDTAGIQARIADIREMREDMKKM